MRDERGTTTVEHLGVFVVVGALIATLSLTPAARPVVDGIRTAICRIIGAAGGDPCASPQAGPVAVGRPSGEPLDPCVRSAHEESGSIGFKIGVVKVGSSMYTTREETSDGKVTLTYANGYKAGLTAGAGGKAKLRVGGKDVGAAASVGVEGGYSGRIGDSYQFQDARQADEFEKKVDEAFMDLMTPSFSPYGAGGRPSDPGTIGMYLKSAAETVAKKMKPPPTRVTYEQGGGSVELEIGGTLGPGETKAGASVAEFKGRRTDEATGQVTEYFQLNEALKGSAGVLFLGGVQGVKDTSQVVTLVKDRNGKPMRATIATTTKVTKGFQWPASLKEEPPAVKAQHAAAKAALEKVAVNLKDGETKAVTVTAEVPIDDAQSMNLVAGLLTGTDPATGQRVDFTTTADELQARAAGMGTTSILTSTGNDGGLDLSVEGAAVLKLGVDVGYSTSDSRVESAQLLPPGSTTPVDWIACVKG